MLCVGSHTGKNIAMLVWYWRHGNQLCFSTFNIATFLLDWEPVAHKAGVSTWFCLAHCKHSKSLLIWIPKWHGDLWKLYLGYLKIVTFSSKPLESWPSFSKATQAIFWLSHLVTLTSESWMHFDCRLLTGFGWWSICLYSLGSSTSIRGKEVNKGKKSFSVASSVTDC